MKTSIDNNARVSDIMTCALSRLLKDGENVFHGVSSHMPMVAIALAKATHGPNIVHLNIPGGVNPKSIKDAEYSSAGQELFKGSEAVLPLSEVFDLSMRGKLDVAFLSGVQFDVSGNVNASVIGDYNKPKVRLPGGAGSAVLIPTAKKAIIWRTKHDKRTFVEKVDFVTTRGNLWKIVTPLCVFEFKNGSLKLDSIHPTSSLEEVIENTEFKVVYDEVKYTPMPSEEELKALKRIDPYDLRSK
ncbi:3-oxoadipate CoA-transferase subunit B [Clostridium homopropionicum DSM 5847]|uniref:3-oxoadipate CoA-transferase subunit B n=1 Tax=Clostridium homopropionicum DSM 5847 TaxID=1121318 RepID=A0A0L6Z6I8_9CLOT|nr:CoA-transferase [Clostridium homopropionicum]KOA18584.1 3-oxoadipate CoA-transferase subunit B [Clostridium homopropionicum DSM 5847]SFG48999.1 glutaconate CoA-transferase subunit B [Clostridium homopropionicum]